MLCSGIDTAEELIKAHVKNSHNEYRSIQVNVGIFAVGRGNDEESGNRFDEEKESGGSYEQDSLISTVDLLIEFVSVGGVVFGYRGHIPRLKEYGRNHTDQVGYTVSVAVDRYGRFAELNAVTLHVADKHTVGETCDSPHNDSGNERSGEFHHIACESSVESIGTDEFAQVSDYEQEK